MPAARRGGVHHHGPVPGRRAHGDLRGQHPPDRGRPLPRPARPSGPHPGDHPALPGGGDHLQGVGPGRVAHRGGGAGRRQLPAGRVLPRGHRHRPRVRQPPEAVGPRGLCGGRPHLPAHQRPRGQHRRLREPAGRRQLRDHVDDRSWPPILPTPSSVTWPPTARPSPATRWGPSPRSTPSTTRAASSRGPSPPSRSPAACCPSTVAPSPMRHPCRCSCCTATTTPPCPITASQQAFATLTGFRWFVTFHGAGHVGLFLPPWGAVVQDAVVVVPELPAQGRPPARRWASPSGGPLGGGQRCSGPPDAPCRGSDR